MSNIPDELDEILHKIGSDINKVYTSEATTPWCTIHYFKLDKGKCVGCEAKAKLNALITAKQVEARIDSLLDLERWIKLHHPNHLAVLECIEHMVVSNLQVPDQPRLDNTDRINELKKGQL